MDMPMTAFVSLGWSKDSPLPPADSPTQIHRTIRWFTPKCEVPLCGHATLAASFALLTHLGEQVKIQEIKYESKSRGTLVATVETIDNHQYVTLNFPVNHSEPVVGVDKTEFRDIFLGSNFTPDDITDVRFSALNNVLLLCLGNTGGDPEERIKQVEPDFGRMLGVKFNEKEIMVAIVTVQGDGNEKGPDFYSRVFAPIIGVPEDHVCGSAHTVMTPFWTAKLAIKNGTTLVARQASARGGDLRVKLNGKRVNLSGRGRVVLTGTLNL